MHGMNTITEKNMPPWFGSKAASGLYQPIISLMPPHDTYIETHLGGGTIMKKKIRAAHNIGIDPDQEALDLFECDYPVQLVRDCALRFLSDYPFTGSELIYSDPPYLLSTRTSPRRYRFDYTEADHRALLALLKSRPCAVMLSGYPSALYDEQLGDWRSIEMPTMTRGGPRTEKLWFNFVPDRVHWASYAGKNKMHRQCVKRKAANWGRRYAAMPRPERMAVMVALMAVEAEESTSGTGPEESARPVF